MGDTWLSEKKFDVVSRLNTISECDGQTDGRTDGHKTMASRALTYSFVQ